MLTQVSRDKLKIDDMSPPARHTADADAMKHHQSLRDYACVKDIDTAKFSYHKGTRGKASGRRGYTTTTSQCIACESNLEVFRRNSSACQEQLKLVHQQRDMTAVELLKIQNMYDEISELVHLELLPQLHHHRTAQKLRDGVQQGRGDVADSMEALRRELELLRHHMSLLSTCPSCPSCANALTTEPRQDGRCGPHFGNARCTHDYPWCNYHESSGWCGNTAEHRDAQDDARFDWRAPDPWQPTAPGYMPATSNTSGIATNREFAHGMHGTRGLKAAHVGQESKEEDEETWTETLTTIFLFAISVLSFVFLSHHHTPSSPDAQSLHSPAPEQMREGEQEEQEPNACTSRQTAAARQWETQGINPAEMSATIKGTVGGGGSGAQISAASSTTSAATAASSTSAASPAPLENDVGQVQAGDVDPIEVDPTDVQTVKNNHGSLSPVSNRLKSKRLSNLSSPFSPWSPVEMVLSSFGDMSDDSELTFEQGVLALRLLVQHCV